MKKFKLGIIIDSFSCRSEEFVKKNNWHVLSLRIEIDGKIHVDNGVELSIEELSKLTYNAKDVKTSLPTPDSIIKLMKETSEMYEKVVVFPISSGLSGTYNAIMVEANKYKNIHVYDLNLVGDQYVLLAKKIEKIFKENSSNFLKVDEYIKNYSKKSRVFVLPKDVGALIRGGRLSGVGKLFVRGFHLFLVLLFDGSPKMVALKKSLKKTYKYTVQKLIKFIDDPKNLENYNFFLTHSQDAESLELARETIKNEGIDSFYSEIHASPIILAHTGEGAIAISVSPKIED